METVPLDQFLIPRFSGLDPKRWENLCLSFLRSGPRLKISRHGREVFRRVIEAFPYAAKSGMKQHGIDIRAKMEGGEEWAFQCKRVEKFGKSELTGAIKAAKDYEAQHFFLVLTCEPTQPAGDEIKKHPKWSIWGPAVFCDELRRLPSGDLKRILNSVLPLAELRRFAPLASGAFIGPGAFFDRQLGEDKAFRHNWELVGRRDDLGAIAKFTDKSDKMALVITSKGGDGKSRLLLAASKAFQERHPDGQVIFYNHNRDPVHDPVEEGFSNLRQPTLLMIDDAHRVDDLPPNLLHAAASIKGLKIILAARPQGLERLNQELRRAGLDDEKREALKLKPLAKTQIKQLAKQALRGVSTPTVDELLHFTKDSAFLTTLTGALLQKGQIKWRNWRSSNHFLSRVFECFKDNNLQSLSEDDRRHAEMLLRLIAILAPVPVGKSDTQDRFLAHAAKIMEQSEDRVDEWLLFLKRADLVGESQRGYRVIPDLFADFLVFDSAYGFDHCGGKPFVRKLLKDEEMRSPAMIRNLAEASWLMGEGEEAAENLLQPLIENEKKLFLGRSFWKRARQIESWHHFSIYLPEASLDLCRLAIDGKEPPPDPECDSSRYAKELDTKTYLLKKLPRLLEEIARHHYEHQARALDMLWELANKMKVDGHFQSESSSPMEAIAKVFTVELESLPDAAMDALRWLRRKVDLPAVREQLASSDILSAALAPCFRWEQERTGRQGSKLWVQRGIVTGREALARRAEALAILKHLIETGDWRCAHRAVNALRMAICGLHKTKLDRVEIGHREKLLATIRGELAKGLALMQLAVERHPHVVIRLAVNRLLSRGTRFAIDPEFATECDKVLRFIPQDPELELALALVSDGSFEDLDAEDDTSGTASTSRYEEARRRWQAKVKTTASKLVKEHQDVSGLAAHMVEMVEVLKAQGFHPMLARLMLAFGESEPEFAKAMAEWLLEHPEHPLSTEWNTLVGPGNSSVTDTERHDLWLQALAGPVTPVRSTALGEVLWQGRFKALPDHLRDVVEALIPRFSENETFIFLTQIQFSHQDNLPWAWSLLDKLPAHASEPNLAEHLLEALTPWSSKGTMPAREIIRGVLRGIEHLEKVPAANGEQGFLRISLMHPREVFDFLRRRMEIAAAAGEKNREYEPLPGGTLGSQPSLGDLSKETDYPNLVEELWAKALEPHKSWRVVHGWRALFQAVVLPHQEHWADRWMAEVRKAQDMDDLRDLVDLLDFDGSLVFVRLPALAKTALIRAEALNGKEGYERMREKLYIASGPGHRGYTNGVLDPQYSYLEAAALEAAKANDNDPVLGPFYRWIVTCEEEDRKRTLAEYQASMAALEAEDE